MEKYSIEDLALREKLFSIILHSKEDKGILTENLNSFILNLEDSKRIRLLYNGVEVLNFDVDKGFDEEEILVVRNENEAIALGIDEMDILKKVSFKKIKEEKEFTILVRNVKDEFDVDDLNKVLGRYRKPFIIDITEYVEVDNYTYIVSELGFTLEEAIEFYNFNLDQYFKSQMEEKEKEEGNKRALEYLNNEFRNIFIRFDERKKGIEPWRNYELFSEEIQAFIEDDLANGYSLLYRPDNREIKVFKKSMENNIEMILYSGLKSSKGKITKINIMESYNNLDNLFKIVVKEKPLIKLSKKMREIEIKEDNDLKEWDEAIESKDVMEDFLKEEKEVNDILDREDSIKDLAESLSKNLDELDEEEIRDLALSLGK
jgi:hypothetical protein